MSVLYDHVFNLSSGLAIHGLANKEHLDTQQPLLLCLHGYLDNANSFLPILTSCQGKLPALAIDLAGHGHSGHRSADANYHQFDYIQDLLDLLELQQWQDVVVMGHSMGGNFAVMLASVAEQLLPQRIRSLYLIESVGPLSMDAETTVSQLSDSIASRLRVARQTPKQPSSWADLVVARMRVSDIGENEAKLILARNVIEYDGHIAYRTDPRLRTKSSVRLTQQQVMDICQQVTCPVTVIAGDQGFPRVPEQIKERQAWYTNLSSHTFTGGHHVHMYHSDEIVDLVLNALIKA